MRSYLIKHGIVAFVAAFLLAFSIAKFEACAPFNFLLWASFAFLNLLFFLLSPYLNRSLTMASQQHFMTFFGTTFAIKFFAALGWMLYWGLLEGVKSNAFILSFFALYFAFLFTMMIEIWFSTKRKTI
jgi:quinol-cytochrome oxidoreductase complex cytochrome b subunit